MVSISPRLRDSLDYEDPDETDPRLSPGFRSLSINSAEYEGYELGGDRQLFGASPDPSANRRKQRERNQHLEMSGRAEHQYDTVADGDAFRLVILLPGTGSEPIKCQLMWESSQRPKREYKCLSYCWESTIRDAAIICDGYRFSVTKSLLTALRHLRSPTGTMLIFIDQICIDQDNLAELAHQVSIMKHIFTRAKEVLIWLGEADDRSEKLCEYAKKMRRGDDSPKAQVLRIFDNSPKQQLNRILPPRQLQDAIQKLLQRPWFRRVWVIPEVALSKFAVVHIGKSHLSWDNLVRLIRDAQLPQSSGFDKQSSLLGNPRQRIAILAQMSASQKERLAQTDITQLLILAKSSKATDIRDYVYAFYAMTHITTYPDYRGSVERLYVDIATMYVNTIQHETSYSSWHGLSEQQRAFQLTSILYSAGSLHQDTSHLSLPSWVPDWTCSWWLAPLWAKTTSNIGTYSGKDDWTTGIRTDYRAGGDTIETFEVEGQRLRVSFIVIDTVAIVNNDTPAVTPSVSRVPTRDGVTRSVNDATNPTSPDTPDTPDSLQKSACQDTPTERYGRHFFTTSSGRIGLASPGIEVGDAIGLLLGGDVPFALRKVEGSLDRETEGHDEDATEAYKLLCECLVRDDEVMYGETAHRQWTDARDILLV